MTRFFLSLVTALFLSVSVQAHSPLQSVTPSDGAVLTAALQAIEMRFRGGARLIRFQLVNASDGTKIGLGESHLIAESDEHRIILPPLPAGDFTASWRALSEDGHVIKGGFSFSVTGG
jgi:methionine-rich copper-binding protein CopC